METEQHYLNRTILHLDLAIEGDTLTTREKVHFALERATVTADLLELEGFTSNANSLRRKVASLRGVWL